MTSQAAPDWIGVVVDGTELRGWAMRDGRAQGGSKTATNIGSDSESALAAILDQLDAGPSTPVVACGLKTDTPWRAVPCTPFDTTLPTVAMAGRQVHLIPGLRQSTPSDLMQAPVLLIAGFLALNPGWDGVICLPGSQTVWAQISAGEVVSFQTYLSGTLAELIGTHPLFRSALSGTDRDEATFDRTVEDALSRPEKLAARLFSIHADHVLEQTDPAIGAARLSGLLIGAELAAARPYWLGMNLALVGSTEATAPYARALQTQGAPATIADAERMMFAGLTAAYRLSQSPANAT